MLLDSSLPSTRSTLETNQDCTADMRCQEHQLEIRSTGPEIHRLGDRSLPRTLRHHIQVDLPVYNISRRSAKRFAGLEGKGSGIAVAWL